MKQVINKISIILLSLFFLGCDIGSCISNQQKSSKLIIETGVEVNGYVISIIEFDSCQYLVSGVGYAQAITHKGNCKFCLERIKNK